MTILLIKTGEIGTSEMLIDFRFIKFLQKEHQSVQYNRSSTVNENPKNMITSKCCGCFSEDQILDSSAVCPAHNTPYMYLCLNEEPQCMYKPLMCPHCLESHKSHKFELISNYFTQEVRHTLREGTSANGHAVYRMYDHVLNDIDKMRGKLNKEIDKLEATARYEIDQLRKRYPLKDKFGVPGTDLNQENIAFLLKIVEGEKNRVWVPSSEKYIRYLFGEVTTMIGNLLYDLDEHINEQSWEELDDYKSDLKIQEFVKKYSAQYDPDRHYFKFSGQDKHYNIKIAEENLQAQYIDTNPSKPAVVTDNPFTKRNDIVYFKMTKVSKTMKLFDASLVIVGACMPDTAKIFGFRNLLEPAHGAYMIGSNGKCYHSSMTKYDKKALSFGFGQDDVIAVQIDYQKKFVLFSKWGFFERKFKMELDLDDESIFKLRPVLLFHGEKGAIVHIVDEIDYKGKNKVDDEI